MKVLKNKNMRVEFLLLLLCFAVCAAVCFVLHPYAGIAVLCTGAAVTAIFLAENRKRYRAIARLSDTLDRMLHGEDDLQLSCYTEGELEILQCEIRKLLQRLKEQSDALRCEKLLLADSIADISHQLRTPMTAINLNLASLQSTVQDEEKTAEYCFEIKKQLERMDWLLTALLKLARLDADAVKMKREPILLENAVKKALQPLEIIMEIKEQQVVCDISGSFYGDSDWTAEALGNILKNCTEHMRQGQITITGQENPLFSTLVIRDSGDGFAPEDLPYLFERFYKGKNASEKSVGIGLALARRIITVQNGTIKAYNHPDGGAVFEIRFYKSTV